MGANKLPKDKVPVELDRFIRMEANNVSREIKLKELFGIDVNTADPRVINNADVKMCRWRKHPMYDAIWKDELSRQDYGDYVEAREVLRKSMRQGKDGWLAMNSAIQIINNGNRKLFNEDNNKIQVEITGMPDIGSPDDGE